MGHGIGGVKIIPPPIQRFTGTAHGHRSCAKQCLQSPLTDKGINQFKGMQIPPSPLGGVMTKSLGQFLPGDMGGPDKKISHGFRFTGSAYIIKKKSLTGQHKLQEALLPIIPGSQQRLNFLWPQIIFKHGQGKMPVYGLENQRPRFFRIIFKIPVRQDPPQIFCLFVCQKNPRHNRGDAPGHYIARIPLIFPHIKKSLFVFFRHEFL